MDSLVNNGELIRKAPEMTNPFGVYVHTPFCVHKCSYCDFYSFTRYDRSDFESCVEAQLQELSQAKAWLDSLRKKVPAVSSIFFGGGTPSLLPPELVARVIERVEACFGIQAGAEITLEANPETVSDDFAVALRSTPFNRVSLGAQSFDPKFLKALERLSTPEGVARASEILTRHGFENFNLDLIFGIPGQTEQGILNDIEQAASLGPKHISFYNLTLKPGHVLYSNLPDDDASADFYERGVERLAEFGYEGYEISNFAKRGFESRHNLLYWNGGDFLGIGPSASSRFFWDGVFHHRKQLSDYKAYLARKGFLEPPFEATNSAQTILEATFLEMRKREGVSLSRFRAKYGYAIERAKNYPLFLKEGLITRSRDELRLTARGRLLADRVTRDLVD